jgi:hypothetical protein
VAITASKTLRKNANHWKIISIGILLFFSCHSLAQKSLIKGVLTDTANKRKLHYAVAVLVNAKDSFLVSSARSHSDGSFFLNDVKAGSYSLLVTYPQMADFIVELNLKEKDTINLGNIIMTSRIRLLEEVVVRSSVAAIRMKGDTLEYKADSFLTRPNASVEDLLKRLPGIQVNRDGSIKAQGENVAKVLVDGDEFFGDDPALATRYLHAGSVDKVQVYDQKSDQANFTGIDDGKRSKTINIQLKANSKKGYFGKLSAGSNAEGIYNHQAMLGSFKKKQKVAVFAATSNTGATGISWQDRYNLLGNDFNIDNIDDNMDGVLFDYDDYGDYYGSSGLPKSINANAFFSDKWKENKQSLNGNYGFSRLSNYGFQNSYYKQQLPDSSIQATRSFSNNSSNREKHNVSATYNWNIDSFTTVKFSAKGSTNKNDAVGNNESETVNEKTGNPLNSSNQQTLSNGFGSNFNVAMVLRKRFRKKGRTISMNMQFDKNESDGMLQTESINLLYDPVTGIPIQESPNLQQHNKQNTVDYAVKLTFTEPLSKNLSLEFAYAIKFTNTGKDRTVFGKDANNKYESFVDSLSNGYHYNVVSHMPNAMLRYNKKKINASFGSSVFLTTLNQYGISAPQQKRLFTNFAPKASIRFEPKQTSHLGIEYSGQTRQPSIMQLQPLRDKSNPLHESIGNPNLKPSFSHNFSMNYNSFNLQNESNFSMHANANITQDAIVYSQEYDQFNKSVSQYLNNNGNYSVGGSVSYNRPFKKRQFVLGLSMNVYQYANTSFLNKVRNLQKNTSIGLSPSIELELPNQVLHISIRSSIDYSKSTSTITGNVANSFWSHRHTVEALAFLPWKLELKTNANIQFQPSNSAFVNRMNIIKWNASLNKKLTKNEKLEVALSVVDILNQATGYYAYAEGNTVSETTSNYIPRYFMLSLNWNFTHTNK